MDTPNNRGSGTTSANKSSPYRASHAASGSYYAGGSRARVGGTGPPKWRQSPFYRIDRAVSVVQECPEMESSQLHLLEILEFPGVSRETSAVLTTLLHRCANYDNLSAYVLQCVDEYLRRQGFSVNTIGVLLGSSARSRPLAGVLLREQLVGLVADALNNEASRWMGYVMPKTMQSVKVLGPQELVEAQADADVGRGITTEDSSDSEKEDRAITIGNLVGVTSVDGLVERLRRRLKPMEQVIASIKARQVDDDEVQAGPIKLSLRDPLTYMRMSLPCRASSCVHIGCFDAICWYAMMEQTSTRLCPICDRVLDPDELIIDGFVSDILAKVHKDVDNVIIEPDGEWHTEDRKAGSVTWMQKYGTTEATKTLRRPKRIVPVPSSTTPSGPSTIIIIGDSSESEEEVREVKRWVSSPPVTIPAPRPAALEVIDLTLSDSDEDPAHV